jgi:acetyl-CoA carboxylase biotin carboxyl carrier protein
VVVAPGTDGADNADGAGKAGTTRGARNDVRETRARQPVAYGQRMLVLDPALGAEPGLAAAAGATSEQPEAEGLVFRAPMSGRFYSRSSPDKPPLVQVGDVIHTGTTVCLLEVMKTFNRVSYGGDDLPDTARIIEIRPGDEDDLDAGDIILVLESA